MLRRTRVLSFFLGAVVVLTPLIGVLPEAKAYEVQTVISVNCGTTEYLVGSDYLAQTFVPGVDNIDNVGVMVANKSASSVKFNIALYGPDGWLAVRPQTLPGNSNWPYRYIDPQYPIPVDRNTVYSVWVYPYSGYENNQIYLRGGSSGSDSCYGNGSAWRNIFSPLNADITFVVFGHNNDATPPETPAAPPADQGTGLTSIDTVAANTPADSTDNSAAGASTTTTQSKSQKSSNAPKNLTAAYDSTTKAVNLAWEASTLKNLASYEVYRANSEDNLFTKIAVLNSEQLTYSDNNIKYNDQYIYYIAGVSATATSDSSNTVTVLIDDKALKPPITAVENTTVNFWDKVKENISYNLLLILGLGALILAIIFGLLLYEEKRRHKATLKKLNG